MRKTAVSVITAAGGALLLGAIVNAPIQTASATADESVKVTFDQLENSLKKYEGKWLAYTDDNGDLVNSSSVLYRYTLVNNKTIHIDVKGTGNLAAVAIPVIGGGGYSNKYTIGAGITSIGNDWGGNAL